MRDTIEEQLKIHLDGRDPALLPSIHI